MSNNQDLITQGNVERGKRAYHPITEEEVRDFHVKQASGLTGGDIVRKRYPDLIEPHNRAFRIKQLAKGADKDKYVEDALSEIQVDAINTVGALIHSSTPEIQANLSKWTLEQKRGKAISRSENKNININIESVLD